MVKALSTVAQIIGSIPISLDGPCAQLRCSQYHRKTRNLSQLGLPCSKHVF